MAPKSLREYAYAVKALLIENGVRRIDYLRAEINRLLRRSIGKQKKILKRDLFVKEELLGCFDMLIRE